MSDDEPEMTVAERQTANDDSLWRALGDVNDPEFPISVVDMGLIQRITREGSSGRVRVELTFTAMGCPAMDMILDDVRARLLQEPGVREVQIDIVWDPPWTKARLSEASRARLRGMGIGI